jgi:hypothetical protein
MRLLPTFVLGAALILGACQNSDGSTNWGGTLALGAGLGVAAGLAAAALSDNDRPRRHEATRHRDRRYAENYREARYHDRW